MTITIFIGINIFNILANNRYEKQDQKIIQFNKIKNQKTSDYNWGFIKEASIEIILKTLRKKYHMINFDEFNVSI
ncbi:hypothetical protein [Spiroplasma endosymbiont of Polydrusus formosus]|uniref:hypothetical protein n=1 Tax=Spiroplasma endosymbiont of Polydrusus formosus TaxID=3139326 RepID=UPI0035B502F4